jgi:hypothetical protein
MAYRRIGGDVRHIGAIEIANDRNVQPICHSPVLPALTPP